jgi:hypothetical protein
MSYMNFSPTSSDAILDDSADHPRRSPEPEDPYAVIFWETYHRLQEDIDGLTAQPNTEFSLLSRYFRNHAGSVKEILEYRGLLSECLDHLNNPDVRVTDRIMSTGNLGPVMEWTPDQLLELLVMETIREEVEWLRSSPRTTHEISEALFVEALGAKESRLDMLLLIFNCMNDNGFRAHTRSDGEMAWLWIEG